MIFYYSDINKTQILIFDLKTFINYIDILLLTYQVNKIPRCKNN